MYLGLTSDEDDEEYSRFSQIPLTVGDSIALAANDGDSGPPEGTTVTATHPGQLTITTSDGDGRLLVVVDGDFGTATIDHPTLWVYGPELVFVAAPTSPPRLTVYE